MVFNKKSNSIFSKAKNNKIIEGQEISTFLGHLSAEGSNILNYKLGELIYNRNMEWRYSGSSKFLRTKRGSTLYKDIVKKSIGSGVFRDDGTNYIIWVDSEGALKYLNGSTEVTLTTGLDTTYNHEFWFYGLNDNETLYGCNRTDGLYKISRVATVLTYASVLSTPGIWSMSFSNISGRLILTSGHKALYSSVQNQTSLDTSNLEDFDVDNRTLWVNPDQGEGIQRVVENGEITFYFKDTGIWALVNAEEDIDNWMQPQCNADVGTKSPETVSYVKYGQKEAFAYLGTDKTLRLFNAQVTRNSGATPTLTGGDSLIISRPFQKILNAIPDDQLSKCNGYGYGNYYILNIVSEGGSDIDTTLIIDTDKLMDYTQADDINQPYWLFADNMEYTNYVVIDNVGLYGFHKYGYICKLFVNDKYYEEIPDRITPTRDFRDYIVISGLVGTFRKRETITGGTSGNTATTTIEFGDEYLLVKSSNGNWTIGETITGGTSLATGTIVSVVRRAAIEWEVYTGWNKYSGRELKLYDAYLNWSVGSGNWAINFTVNSFIFGSPIPIFSSGIAYSIKPQSIGGAYFDSSYFNESYFDYGVGQLSQNTGGQGRGNYFSFGFYNNNYNEWATIYSIEPRFEVIKNDSIGKNF